jgi:hypothetical protein
MFFKVGGNTKKRRVLKSFAFLPTHIGNLPDGKRLYCWLEWYLIKERMIAALHVHYFRPVKGILPGFVPRTEEFTLY